jgi:hypothetical protein
MFDFNRFRDQFAITLGMTGLRRGNGVCWCPKELQKLSPKRKEEKKGEISEYLPSKNSSKILSNAHQYAEKSVAAPPSGWIRKRRKFNYINGYM